MRRALVIAALTLTAAATAAYGLVGNASFARDVPVRVPASAILLDDRGSERPATAVLSRQPVAVTTHRSTAGSTGTTTASRHADNRTTRHSTETTATTQDDHGGPTTTRQAEPGDDNGGATTTAGLGRRHHRQFGPDQRHPDDRRAEWFLLCRTAGCQPGRYRSFRRRCPQHQNRTDLQCQSGAVVSIAWRLARYPRFSCGFLSPTGRTTRQARSVR
jgi:hypothetical protein